MMMIAFKLLLFGDKVTHVQVYRTIAQVGERILDGVVQNHAKQEFSQKLTALHLMEVAHVHIQIMHNVK